MMRDSALFLPDGRVNAKVATSLTTHTAIEKSLVLAPSPQALKQEFGQIDITQDYRYPRDNHGHSTHTNSTIARSMVPWAKLLQVCQWNSPSG